MLNHQSAPFSFELMCCVKLSLMYSLCFFCTCVLILHSVTGLYVSGAAEVKFAEHLKQAIKADKENLIPVCI